VEVQQILEPSFELFQNYPNPFHTVTSISYSIPEETVVRLSCYNIVGEEVATLMIDNMLPGIHTITFDGSSLPPGPYSYAIETRRSRIVRKMLKVR
jgi:hypothetical protein